MERKLASSVELDSAVFQVSASDNRYDAIACSKGNAELIASGPFDQLVLHLEDAKKFQSSSSGTFKLLLAGDGKGSSWFTKSTLERFLHIINSSDTSKSVNGIFDEMSQLEETRKFHQSLYSKGQQIDASGGLTGGLFGTGAIAQQGNIEPHSSETTKNELLRALNLRLTALKEEILVLLNQAVGSSLSKREISDLACFVQRFGTSEFSWLMRCMLLIADHQSSELPLQQDSTAETIDKGENGDKTHDVRPQSNLQRPIANTVSPAKLAQIERESSTDDSSESSDEGEAVVERSRPMLRAASPRRSASPMRRVQIGRSGSRRSTAIAIKSLSYFPPSQRTPMDKDDESSTCNGETDQPPRKSDNNVRRMSVQDAINLFESKQKDQNPDSQNKKAGLFATKSVLRRWSAGMGDSLNDKSEEKISDLTSESKSNNMASETEKDGVEMKDEPDKAPETESPVTSEVEGLTCHGDSHGIRMPETGSAVSSNISPEQTRSGQEESRDRAIASAEWNRQKEAELNQMLMKMMEVMPGKFAGANATAAGINLANQQKSGSRGQQREKRDTEVRTGKGTRRPVKEASTKPLKETIGHNKSAMTPKIGTASEKRISPVPQRAWRNSSPPVLPKEVAPKTTVRKTSPKPSPAPAAPPATRSSWSGGSLTKATISQKTKSSPGVASTSTPSSRRRTPTTPSSSQTVSKVERTVQPVKNKKETGSATKPTVKAQEEKKTRMTTRTSRVTKVSPASEDKSSLTAKQSLHKVSKKSSVVPIESKPLKKATGPSQSVGSVKSKVPRHDDSAKDSGSVNQAEDKEQAPMTTEPTTKVLEADLAQPAHDVDENLEISLDNDLNIEKTEKPASSLTATEMGSSDQVEPSTNEVQPPDEDMQPPDEDMGISSAAWVEVEHQEQEVTDPSENVEAEDVTSPGIAPLPSSSPRVRHSLSQMLQADSNEPEIIEWGNAENPPAIVFQKDSPKGFKRLLKFARKNKGDNNTNGWASPSVVSEGEDEFEESKGSDGANSSRRTFDGSKTSSILSAQSTTGSFNSDKLRERPGAAPSTKASRSFFSLSNFRSSRSNESKLR